MNKRRVLVVEDDNLNIKLKRDILTANGYEVIEATDGMEGVKLAAEKLPDLILMDMHLPGINGIEAFRRIRGDAATREIPVIFVTASAQAIDKELILQSGPDGYLVKPFDIDELLELVKSKCGKKK